jgi:mRNA interferase HicA
VKRRDLLGRIAKAAAEAGVEFGLVREGGQHSVYRCGALRLTVPRHTEVNEITARSIMRHLEAELGKGWWR